jgi:hypothetical protein
MNPPVPPFPEFVTLGLDTFGDVKYGMPGMSHAQVLTCVELFGAKVAPMVRDMLSAS